MAITAALALIVVVVGLASLEPKSKPQFVNELPVADFDFVVTNLEVAFNASASSDPDGTIANYSWSFGDNNVGHGELVDYVYEQADTYEVELTVTDDDGDTNSTTKAVTTSKAVPPEPPVASELEAIIEVVSKKNLTVVVSGENSKSPEGAEIVSYEWNFGDGMSGIGVEATHTYTANGTYTITLTVFDSQGDSDSASIEVKVKRDSPSPPPPDEKEGPPGLYIAIENHEDMAGKNKGMQNSLDHIRWSLESWIEKHGNT
ncbi:MAG: PKD domain-containing protein [Candidatus Thermoplasmatota archaeon]|nr:PKD domain-containing protein [Candidatus Thermoplasmatota archaeon]